jgi:hypothetical protein
VHVAGHLQRHRACTCRVVIAAGHEHTDASLGEALRPGPKPALGPERALSRVVGVTRDDEEGRLPLETHIHDPLERGERGLDARVAHARLGSVHPPERRIQVQVRGVHESQAIGHGFPSVGAHPILDRGSDM